MFAMIVLDLKTKKLNIIHNSKGKIVVVTSDQAAEKYIAKHMPDSRLLGTFPDPSDLISIVLKEYKSGSPQKEDTQGQRKSTGKKEQKQRPSVVKRTR